ncbi:hypothetical protein ANN_23270 [Periplaneta americana]|uniref:Uncharacterized protein n=1 Tax=Periplaneta americana TaxID=6978 RepID=A0ABQ8SLW7_PERAM|nr:hypothetical protein ANN_23270 [Periplaneta americana]
MAGLYEGGSEPAGCLKAIYSQLKMAAPFKSFGEANISEIEFLSRKYGIPTEEMRIKHCDKEERARVVDEKQ